MSLSCVSANENITSEFKDFSDEINHADDNLNLTDDCICSDDEICIDKNITIDGNNHSVFTDDSSDVLIINVTDSSNFVLKNIIFNDKLQFITNSSNITLIDTCFNLSAQDNVDVINKYYDLDYEKCTTISQDVVNQAKLIVGSTTGLDAIIKIAKWVGSNIKHETNAGFYQSPSTTLARKLGNCCSQTLLFLQMCEAMGLTKDHEIYFIHVGQSEFKSRHFFAVVDNVCVDVDSYGSKPWGHAKFSNRPVYAMTKYPLLPLPIEFELTFINDCI